MIPCGLPQGSSFTLYNINNYKLKINKNNGSTSKINLNEQLDGYIGENIDLDKFKLIRNGKNGANKNAKIKLLAFFSIHGCGRCLFDELAEWERIYTENQEIELYAICVDSNESDVYRFISYHLPKIPVYRSKGTYFEFAQIAPLVLILDKNNVIKYPYHSEMGNEIKRNNFYKFVNSLKS